MPSVERCTLEAGDLIVQRDWTLVFISCDGYTAWSVEVSPTFRINLATTSTKQWSDGTLRGVARMQHTLRGNA